MYRIYWEMKQSQQGQIVESWYDKLWYIEVYKLEIDTVGLLHNN